MPRQRDYKSEYQRRIAHGLARGRTRSEARGHPRTGERHVSAKTAERSGDHKLLAALRSLREVGSLTEAARRSKVAPERLRRFVRTLDFVEKRGQRYSVGEDRWLRRVLFYSDGRRVTTAVQGYEEARRVGLYWEAVGEFRNHNEPAYLAPFVGAQITSASGRTYTLETRPNVLYRLANEGEEPFEQIYALTL